MSETEKNERIAELEATSANLLTEVRRLHRAYAELERIAAHRLDELVKARGHELELEEKLSQEQAGHSAAEEEAARLRHVFALAEAFGGCSPEWAVEMDRLRGQVAELERIAASRLDELADLRARVQEPAGRCRLLAAERDEARARLAELEPLAEVGRRFEELDADRLARIIRAVDGEHKLGAAELAEAILDALRAAGIGEEVVHG